jgi:hypothetical protein
MSEELKKEWEIQFEEEFFPDGGDHVDSSGIVNIKNFISSLLAKQQDIPMGYSQWLAYGKKFGYHDYWKDMTRIVLQEEFVKIIAELATKSVENGLPGMYREALADIKSKIK